MPRAGMSRLDTFLPPEVKLRLDIACELHGVWIADVVAEALRQYLDKLEGRAPAPESVKKDKGFRGEC